MATQTVEFRAPTGLTITAKVFEVGSDTQVASVLATEETNRKGTYTAAFTDVAAGEYQLIALDGSSIPLASWWVTLTLTTATFQVYDRVDKDGITKSNWAALTVDHTSTGSFGAAIGALPLAPAIADAVWDEAMSGHTANGSYGSHIVRSANQNQNTVSITGSQHIAADVHAFQSNVIDATALASSAVTEIQVGLATSSGVTAAFTEIKGATWSSSTDTLEAIRDASGGGGTSIMVTPVVAQVPVRVRDTDIETYIGDLSTIRIGIFSGEDAVDLSGFGDLEVCVQAKDGTDLDFIEMADLTIDGTDNNYVSWDPSGPSVATIRRGKWSLRKSSNKQVIAKGAWIISDAALEDTGS